MAHDATARRRHLGPRATPDVAGMFDDYSFLLSGAAFEEHHAAMSLSAKQNFAFVSDLLAGLRAQRWEDQLRPEQAGKYTFVDRIEAWNVISPPFVSALATLPVLGVGVEVDQDVLKYMTLSTYDGNTVTLAVNALAEAAPGWLRRSEVLPLEVRDWLQDQDVFVLSVGLEAQLAAAHDGLSINNYVDCCNMFILYQRLGVIHPTFAVASPDYAWILTYAIGYHHCPADERKFNYLVGHHAYDNWPSHRQLDWRPRPHVLPSPVEKFYFFYEANGTFAFIYRLILHGLVYGGLAAVPNNESFPDTVLHFLRGAGLPKAQVQLRDPLSLVSDVGAPNYPPFALRVPVGGDPPPPFPDGKQQVGASVAPPTATVGREQEEARTPLCPGAQGGPPREAGPPFAAAPTAATGVDNDVVVLTDHDLVAELDREAAPGIEENNPEDVDAPHEHKREVQVIPGSSKPQGIFARIRSRRTEAEQRPHSILRGASSYTGEARQPHPQAATGSNREPLGLTPGGTSTDVPPAMDMETEEAGQEAPAPLGPEDLRHRVTSQQTQTGVVAGEEDLRHKLASRPPQPRFFAIDARCRMDENTVTTNASVFSGEAAAAPASGTFLPSPAPHPGMTFVRQLANRNKVDPSPVVSKESLLAAPVDRRAVLQPRLTRLEKAWNPYMLNPIFDHRCTVCSSQHCSRYLKESREPNCKKWREACYAARSRRLCDYRRCRRPLQHHTVVCPYLHGKCARCGVRGHDVYDGCEEKNESIMARFREDFEEQANVGLYTRLRTEEVAWGFFPVPSSAPRGSPPFFDYRFVLEKTATAGIAFVRALLAASDNQVDPPEPLPSDHAFHRGADPRPPPPEGWLDRNSAELNPGPF